MWSQLDESQYPSGVEAPQPSHVYDSILLMEREVS